MANTTKPNEKEQNKPESKVKENKEAKLNFNNLEEEDLFEDFPVEEWEQEKSIKTSLENWQDNWDDDDVEEDFSILLREEKLAIAK